MSIRTNRTRLRDERRTRGWSQEQLAEISGISTRTLQRLEQGKTAAPQSIVALAHALSVPAESLTIAAGPVRRITPLMILHDLSAIRSFHEGLGFAVTETGDPDCIGLRAGNTALILCSLDFMRGDYRHADLDTLAGQTIPYIWLDTLDSVRGMDITAIEEVVTRSGTREIMAEIRGQRLILAEIA